MTDGRRYKGAIDPDNRQPHGLGVITLDEGTYYAGEFVHGKMHGRGFLLTCEMWQSVDPVWIGGSYEQVMATAVFDSAGRITHTDTVGHWSKELTSHERWHKDKDGYWEDNRYVREARAVQANRAPWKEAVTAYMSREVNNGNPGYIYYYPRELNRITMGGEYNFNHPAFVTQYDPLHLLVCTEQGEVFVLGAERETLVTEQYSPTILREHRYFLTFGTQYKEHIRLMLDNCDRQQPGLESHLYHDALASMLFAVHSDRMTASGYFGDFPDAELPEQMIAEESDHLLRLTLPSDNWRIEYADGEAWLYSDLAREPICVTGRRQGGIYAVALMQDELRTYISELTH